MILNNIKYFVLTVAAVAFASCDYLDVVPEGTPTTDDVYKTQTQAEKMVIGCYKEIPNYFHPQQFPDATREQSAWTQPSDTPLTISAIFSGMLRPQAM